MADKYKYKDVKLYLVSDAYGLAGKYGTYEEYKKIQEKKQKIQNRDSLRVDFNLGSKLYKFRGKILKIDYDIPPNPIIKKISWIIADFKAAYLENNNKKYGVWKKFEKNLFAPHFFWKTTVNI